jgi:hypothetical protein
MHPETLRRYLQSGPPALEFFLALHQEGFSVDWVLGGWRAARISDHPKPLSEVPMEEIVVELARRQAISNTLLHRLVVDVEALRRMIAKESEAQTSGVPSSMQTPTLSKTASARGVTEPKPNQDYLLETAKPSAGPVRRALPLRDQEPPGAAEFNSVLARDKSSDTTPPV